MIGNILSISEEGGNYLLRLPFEFKGAFRVLFKTATWDGRRKAFVAKATAANKNKWLKFIGQAKGLEASVLAMEEAEATEVEMRQLEELLAVARRELEHRISAAKARTCEHVQTAAEYRGVIEALEPHLEAGTQNEVKAELDFEVAKAKAHATVAPALDVCKRHGLEDMLQSVIRAARRGYSGKDHLRIEQIKLVALRSELRTVGYRHVYLDELCDASLNRSDKFEHAAPLLQATLVSKFDCL